MSWMTNEALHEEEDEEEEGDGQILDTRNTAFLIFCLDAVTLLISYFFLLLLIYSIACRNSPGFDEWKLPKRPMEHLKGILLVGKLIRFN